MPLLNAPVYNIPALREVGKRCMYIASPFCKGRLRGILKNYAAISGVLSVWYILW
jgi:hypothetical protein